MGSLFKTSTPSVTPTLTQPATVKNSTEPEVGEAVSQDEDSVRDAIRRETRSRSLTIQTSYRGVLEEGAKASSITLSPKRKTLLGE